MMNPYVDDHETLLVEATASCSDNKTGSDLSFLLRPPISDCEVQGAAANIHDVINEAYGAFAAGGVASLKQYIKEKNEKKKPDQNQLCSVEEREEEDQKIQEENAKITGDPRPYQNAMVEIAKRQNTIVQLNTGMGKTLVAIMIIRHFAPEFKEIDSQGYSKQTWFLVPSVALAVQQAHTLKVNLPYKVATACHTAAKSDKARAEMSHAEIVVLTHGSALELLQHYGDMFYLARVNLLVVDECHHATKKHSYVSCFNLFYHTLSTEDRPHVLGLTATPIINIKNPTHENLESKIRELEKTLDSTVVGFSSLSLSPEQSGIIANNVSEKSIVYENPPIDQSLFPSHPHVLNESRTKELNQLLYILDEYGPAVLWKYCQVLSQEISPNYYENETQEQFQGLKNYLQNLCDHFENETKRTGGKTTKLAELELLLNEIYETGFDNSTDFDDVIGIVFVKQKVGALSLHNYFSSDLMRDSHKKSIRSGMLTRKTTDVFKYLSSTQKLNDDQKDQAHNDWLHTIQDAKKVLNSLRSRDINLLFATSVVEEGIDIDACSFVVVLDEIQSTKAYVQMRGRARVLNAKFYVFENTHDESQGPPLSLSDAKMIDSKVSSYLGERRISYNSSIELHSVQMLSSAFPQNVSTALAASEERALKNGYFKVQHGMVSTTSSKSLVNRYCSCIPMDLSARSSRATMKQYQPIYQEHTLILPSHLPEHVRYVYLPPLFRKSSKKLNESSLALIACVRLYEYKVINDRLLPLKREDIQNRLQLFALQTPKRVHVDFHKSIPLQTSEEKEIFIYPLLQNGILFEQNASSISGARGLCIISLISLDTLPAFSFKMTHRQIGLISCTIGQSKKEVIPSNQFEVCRQFYSAIMNARWRRRTGHKFFQTSSDQESTFPSYIVSCLDKNNNLDWDFMNIAVREFQKDDNERKLSAQQWTGQYPRLFSPLYDPNNTYIAFGIEDDMLCSAAFPNKESSSELFESYCDYFSNKWNFNVAKDCKLLKVQRCWELPSKFNENCDEKNDGVNVVEEKESGLCFGLKTVLLPQDACMEAPIADPLLLLHTIALPHILYEIERLETVNRFIQHCTRWSQLSKYLDMIDTDKIQVVLTAKSCSVGDKCYDKLEYLGDAVLKLIHTDALINAKDGELRKWFHCLHEGDLTNLRTVMGSNSRLKHIAERAGFDAFILTVPLGRGTWLSSGLEACRINAEGVSEHLQASDDTFSPSAKVIADVVEALLGLIYLNCGYKATQEVCLELQISTPHSHESLHHLNPSINSDTDSYSVEKAKEFLGVDFQNAQFVMEAFTHPTKIGSTNYQRLEWIGDAVLCLAAREWIYHNYQSILDVKDMVNIETVLVCNETLSKLAFSSRLNGHILHCDSSLPGRLEQYQFEVDQEKKGLWSTNPPKVLADVVEALIGVAHIEGGLDKGQHAARHVIDQMLKSVKVHLNGICEHDEKMDQIKHPAQALMGICPTVRIQGCNIIDYKNNHSSPVWFGNSWDDCSREFISYGEVGRTSFFGLNLCSVSHKNSRNIAKMKAAALLFNVLRESSEIRSKLELMTKALSDDKK